MQVINHGNENVLLRDTTKVIYLTHSLGRDLLRTRRHLTEIITSPSRVMGRIRPYAGIGKVNFPYGNSHLWLQSIIFLPSWTKQINSKVGISSFITGTDVLKVQNENRNSYRFFITKSSKLAQKQKNINLPWWSICEMVLPHRRSAKQLLRISCLKEKKSGK